MLLALLAAASVASATAPVPATWTHSVQVTHGTADANAIYTARPIVTTRDIGMSAGTRMSSQRCVWTADIAVERRLEAAGMESTGRREMPSTKTLTGSRPGACVGNRRLIDQEIAGHTPAIEAHLVAVAERDQRDLRSEIETLAPPTGR
jgi:hypothetical protein